MNRENIFFTDSGQIGQKHIPTSENDKMATGGNVLLAPNGKRSDLTPEQYKLVRTPEFKAWFGDWENDPENASKVVDENGEPLPVYHGTTEDFTTFQEKPYFTDDYMNADGYANGEIVIEAFLKLKNPLIINAKGRKWDDLKSKYGTSTRDIVGALDQEKYDGVIFYKINDNWFDDEGEPQNVYNVNKPSQIKLGDGRNTTFDPYNADIRFRDGGQINSSPFMEWYSQWYEGISDKMNILFSFPSEIVPFKEKNVVILDVFEKIDQNINAKPYLNEITTKADEYGVTIYLEPTPRNKHFEDNLEKKNKITKGYLIKYYEKFGFQLTPNKQFMKRLPKNNSHIRFETDGNVQPKDLTRINNFKNIQKGVDYYSYSDNLQKQYKADRWYELFLKNQKEKQITSEEYNEFILLSKELCWEDLGDDKNLDISFKNGGSLEEGVGNNNVLEYLFNNTEDITPIKINGKTVGGIDVTTYRGDTETLRVHKMLILPEFQGKGLGAKAIKKLFRENPNVKQIIGNATAESKPFWQKIGAEFHSNEHTAFTITRNADTHFKNGGEIDSKIENAKAELLKAFPNLNK